MSLCRSVSFIMHALSHVCMCVRKSCLGCVLIKGHPAICIGKPFLASLKPSSLSVSEVWLKPADLTRVSEVGFWEDGHTPRSWWLYSPGWRGLSGRKRPSRSCRISCPSSSKSGRRSEERYRGGSGRVYTECMCKSSPAGSVMAARSLGAFVAELRRLARQGYPEFAGVVQKEVFAAIRKVNFCILGSAIYCSVKLHSLVMSWVWGHGDTPGESSGGERLAYRLHADLSSSRTMLLPLNIERGGCMKERMRWHRAPAELRDYVLSLPACRQASTGQGGAVLRSHFAMWWLGGVKAQLQTVKSHPAQWLWPGSSNGVGAGTCTARPQ